MTREPGDLPRGDVDVLGRGVSKQELPWWVVVLRGSDAHSTSYLACSILAGRLASLLLGANACPSCIPLRERQQLSLLRPPGRGSCPL